MMNFDNLPGEIFFKNKFVSSDKANIHVLSHSLHFASSVFEGIRIYDFKPFFLENHIERLLESCKLMLLEAPYKKEEMIDICMALIKKNNLKDGYLRPIIFKGVGSMAPESENCKTYLAIAGWKWNSLYKNKNGISLCTSTWKKPHETVFPVKAKSSGSYQIATLAKNYALSAGYDDALLLDLKNNIAEGTACNIFWRIKDKIYTPKTHSILNGITRRIVISILKKLNIPIIVGDFPANHLINSSEVFFTGTAAEIIGIKSLDSHLFNSVEITDLLKKEYNKLKENNEISLNSS